MIRPTDDNEQHPKDHVQAKLNDHPLGIAAEITRAVGISLLSGGLLVFAATMTVNR